MRRSATLRSTECGSATRDCSDGPIDVSRDADAVRRQLGCLPQDSGVSPEVGAGALLAHLAVRDGLTDRLARGRRVRTRTVGPGARRKGAVPERRHLATADPVITAAADGAPFEAGFDPCNPPIDRVSADSRRRLTL